MKVWKIMQIIRRKKGAGRIFVSQDRYVLDGSHRMVAKLNQTPKGRIKTYEIQVGMLDLLILARQFPYAKYRSLSDAKVSK